MHKKNELGQWVTQKEKKEGAGWVGFEGEAMFWPMTGWL
jgi:hypothetical protein